MYAVAQLLYHGSCSTAATVAHIGLGFHDLYIRRGCAIIKGRQDKSYLRIASLPLGCGYRYRRGRVPWRGHVYKLGLYSCPWGVAATIGEAAPLWFRGHLSRFMTIDIRADRWLLKKEG
jgi:hypothetical protein